jgi:hypothetical protein
MGLNTTGRVICSDTKDLALRIKLLFFRLQGPGSSLLYVKTAKSQLKEPLKIGIHQMNIYIALKTLKKEVYNLGTVLTGNSTI